MWIVLEVSKVSWYNTTINQLLFFLFFLMLLTYYYIYHPGFRYLAIEEKLNGKYDKFNSNNGFVKEAANENEKRLTEVAQSFSHFSHVFSKGTEIVVDIQGKDFEYTDPQIHSLSIEYGMADRGKRGIKDFFRTHKCNSYCKVLNLTPYTKVKTEVPANDVIDLT